MKMTKIKAIETVYDGYRFRSRLEARWAVFFNEVNIKYEYEKEGFDLPSGRYLPDFWLPDLDSWLEVKGGIPTEKEIDLGSELALFSKKDFIIVASLPHEIMYHRKQDIPSTFPFCWSYEPTNNEDKDEDWNETFDLDPTCPLYLIQCPCCKQVRFTHCWPYHYGSEECIRYNTYKTCNCFDGYNGHIYIDFENSFIEKAVLKAKQARFEHGESPK